MLDDYIFMIILAIFLVCLLLVGARMSTGWNTFFNKENSNAMRGFWSLIVILVHIPAAYQNCIQDMIGSFAYIGVTFFFMTSSYGLRLGIVKEPDSINFFWRRRLPKLLVPCLLVNFVGGLFSLIQGNGFHLIDLVSLNDWVCWLLICYLFFWIAYKFIGGGVQKYGNLYPHRRV